MCASTMLCGEGQFSPITINSTELKFTYVDRLGKEHVLIDKFSMRLEITKASVFEVTDEAGKIVAYQFRLE